MKITPVPIFFDSMTAWVLTVAVLCTTLLSTALADQRDAPNILWITCEDTGPQLGCYGDTYASTPNIDRFAGRSLRFTSCWSNAPVCAPARTTLITGLYPTSYGAQHMRSSVPLPPQASTLPSLLRQAGYYCCNNNKEDYNFPKPDGMWNDSGNKAHWKNRKPGQPFFAVFNTTVTHEGQIRKRPYTPKHDPSLAPIPPYHPDDPEVRLDWAQYYDRITEMDSFVEQKLQELKASGLEDSTIVFFFGDHGCGLPRGKRWLYQSGLHVPMIVHIPKKYANRFESIYKAGASCDRLVAFVDLVPTVLDLCDLAIPENLHGRSFFAQETETNEYLFGFRDRMDERIDSSRSIRDQRYLYIRNFMPDRPQGTYLNYMFQTPTTLAWKRLFEAGKLSEPQKAFWQAKPIDELYDIQLDPYQINNVVSDPNLQETRAQLSNALKAKMRQLQDTGAIPEDWIRNGKDYVSMQSAVEAAWKSGDAHADPDLLYAMLSSAQVIDRYWGAIAFRACGSTVKNPRIWEIAQGLLNDPSLDVRAVIAESLVRHSQQDTWKSKALQILLDIPLQKTTPWGARMMALNALSDLDTSADQVAELKKTFNSDEKIWNGAVPQRYTEYLGRLIERMD